MRKKLKSLLLITLSLLMLGLVGCGDGKTTSDSDTSSKDTPTTKEEYAKYLNDRYNYYLSDSKLSSDYDIYVDSFTYNGTNEEFLTAYGDAYGTLRTQLLALKSDLETNIKKGTSEVDKLNQEVITSIDKVVLSIDDFNQSYSTKVKDYGTLAKDEMVKGMQAVGRVPHDARMELDRLVKDAKNTLGIE